MTEILSFAVAQQIQGTKFRKTRCHGYFKDLFELATWIQNIINKYNKLYLVHPIPHVLIADQGQKNKILPSAKDQTTKFPP